MSITVEKAFQLYMAVRLHFTSDYDVFKHKGRFKMQSKVASRTDLYLVKGLISMAPEGREFVELCACNFLYGNDKFLYGHEYVQENWAKWRKNKEAITYTLQSDVNHILQRMEMQEWTHGNSAYTFSDYLKNEAISDLLSGKIQYETLIISERYFPTLDRIQGFNAETYIRRMKKANKFVIGGRTYDLHREIVNNLKEEQER
jgi:hypothetical protein